MNYFDPFWEQIRENVQHNSHWVGSARMGPSAPRDPSVGRKHEHEGSSTKTGGPATKEEQQGVDSAEATSVLDASFCVRGVRNLRVVGEWLPLYRIFHVCDMSYLGTRTAADASVFPVIPNGNVHSSVVMMATRAAEMLISQYKQDNKKSSKL